ncbi:glycosyltransferase family 25 protein [Rhizobium rhododendri]|uniref:Glycosyltransferase family 25 protein n=1 Tax=Rhizobium rhododendri TaxID=2506430 RepID=A0ABY8INC0_9HYPH|nr:glycosyltransferase family 25 protein [Rhizobium rhododendri]WFS25227.1 glycosyltransferase family 25 protein [Rhizobium rhododendri]
MDIAAESLLNNFERIRIINLTDRTDRRRDTEIQLRRIGVRVDGDRVAFHAAIRPSCNGGFPSVGAYGCFLSHREVLRDAVDQGVSSVLIFEDDLNFSTDYGSKIPACMTALSHKDWSLFYGGHGDISYPSDVKEAVFRVDPSDWVLGAHFIALNGVALKQISAYLDHCLEWIARDFATAPHGIDSAYGRFRREYPELLAFAASPVLGYQRSSRSDISTKALEKNVVGRVFYKLARDVRRSLSPNL